MLNSTFVPNKQKIDFGAGIPRFALSRLKTQDSRLITKLAA
jgi:hypothetical protein